MRFLRFITILFLALCSNAIYSQDYKFLWGVDNNTVFDNREGDKTYAPQQTIFFTRLSPSVGVQFQGDHKLVVGTHYIQPIGIGYKENKFVPTAYYSFHKSGKKVTMVGDQPYRSRSWSVSFGMIPRRLMVLTTPAILWSDSMNYYNPNIRGILLRCAKSSHAVHELSLDWRSLQSAKQREAFNVNYSFQKNFRQDTSSTDKPFFIGGNVQLNHLAKRNPSPEGEGVNDDMFIYPFIGWNFSGKTIFDVLYLKTGYAVSFDRCRALGDWEIDGGVLAEFLLLWKKIGLKETLYAGNKQFPLYPMYGSLLNMGDPHYQSSVYSLTSVYSPIVSNQYVNFGAYLDFHVTKEGTSCYQRVVLNINLGNVDK